MGTKGSFGFFSRYWKVRVRGVLLLIVLHVFLYGCSGDLNPGSQYTSTSTSEESQEQIAALGPISRTTRGFDDRTDRIIRLYGKAIKKGARKYGFDWRFVLAIMKQESQFITNATSQRGAYGLMQLMPVTRYEVADALGYEHADLFHPRHNIAGGIYYFRKLYNLFDGAEAEERLRLGLAAYNAGASRVYDAQDIVAYLGEIPLRWAAIRDALPLLSKRYYTLHQHVWQDGKPRSGYFGDWQQTVNYVENVMGYYEDYRHVLE